MKTDTEDKQYWCSYGERLEEAFCERLAPKIGMQALINPAKRHDKYQPDLVVNNVTCDLKVQSTPFFTSGRYGVDPQYAVTFNKKDRVRYSEKYPDIGIIFVVSFKEQTQYGVSISRSLSVHLAPFSHIDELCDEKKLHAYERRQNDEIGNAKESYVLDARDIKTIYAEA